MLSIYYIISLFAVPRRDRQSKWNPEILMRREDRFLSTELAHKDGGVRREIIVGNWTGDLSTNAYMAKYVCRLDKE